MGMFKNLERVARKELETLDAKYEGKNEFSKEDAELFKCLTIGWEKLLKGEKLHKEAEEMEKEQEMGGVSFRNQPRNMHNGQYMSREMGDGWSGSYGPNWYPYPNRNGGPWY